MQAFQVAFLLMAAVAFVVTSPVPQTGERYEIVCNRTLIFLTSTDSAELAPVVAADHDGDADK